MAKEYRVPVYTNYEKTEMIGRVRYNSDLDYWDGSNWTCGAVGRHLGISKLKDGRFALIHGTQWDGEKDYAVVVSPEEALRQVLKTGNAQLLKTKKLKLLQQLAEKMDEIEDLEMEV